MQPAEQGAIANQAPPAPRERTWIFNFLIAPDAIISIGLVDGALSFLLRNAGVDPARAASVIALLSIPHAVYFLWSPVTDFWMRRRTWLMSAAAAAALAFVVAFHLPSLASPTAVWVLFLGACLGVLVAAACGGMMGTLSTETSRRRAGSFYQSGSLSFGGLAVFLLVSLGPRLGLSRLSWFFAALIVLPSLAALAAPGSSLRATGQSARATAARIWCEVQSTFLRRRAIPYALLITAPFSSGAMIGLLPGLARDYGVSGAQVAWMNGIGGALLMAAGALSANLVPCRVRAPIAFSLAGLANAATLGVLAFAPLQPAVYFTGTVLFLFTIGGCYAFFTAVALEFLGGSGKSGSARYSVINSLGNLPVAYMSYLDGRGYAFWGTRGMPAIDAILSAGAASLMLAYFVFGKGNRRVRMGVSARGVD